MSSIDVSAAPAPDVVRPGPPRIHLVPAADSTAAAAAPRTPTDTEVASIFNPSTGLCEWKVRCDACELTYGHGAEIVGRRVAVYWEGDKRWFAGMVIAYKPADEEHVVVYDDGEKRNELLHFVHTRWRFLIEPTIERRIELHRDGVATLAAKCADGRRFLQKWNAIMDGRARAGTARAEDEADADADGGEDDDEEDGDEDEEEADEEEEEEVLKNRKVEGALGTEQTPLGEKGVKPAHVPPTTS